MTGFLLTWHASASRCHAPNSNGLCALSALQWFLAFLTLTMVGFGLAFFALFRQDRQFPDFANIWHSFASMFSYMLAMFDYNVSVTLSLGLLCGRCYCTLNKCRSRYRHPADACGLQCLCLAMLLAPQVHTPDCTHAQYSP